MIKVGLTGGIGTGKSLVATIFSKLGIAVYPADIEARKFLSQPSVIQLIASHFPQHIIRSDGQIDRKELATLVFNDPGALAILNSIIHPLVEKDFLHWCEQHQKAEWVILEAAILFESGFNKLMDKTIVVAAPVELCISRVMSRDNISSEQVIARMNNQWDAEKLIKKADYIIRNDDHQPVLPQVLDLVKEFSCL